MHNLSEILSGPGRSIAIAGHVHPDGDCIGSCVGLLLYIEENYPQHRAAVFLEETKGALLFLTEGRGIRSAVPEGMQFDQLILCDVSSPDRIGVCPELLAAVEDTVSIDHHITNPGICRINHIEPEASSCSEVLAGLMDAERISPEAAEALYTGIVHDSGVFQYGSTSPRTMRTAAMLMEKGIPFSRIIQESFFARSFAESRALGFVLSRAELSGGGLLAVGSITAAEMQEIGAGLPDLDGIAAQLRLIRGTEAAAFFYETAPGSVKVSLRSTNYLNVSELAGRFGGGGHVRAAGCTLSGTVEEAKAALVPVLLDALSEGGAPAL